MWVRPLRHGSLYREYRHKTLRFLEMFKSSYYADVSLTQWLALTPPELVQAHLNVDQQVTSALKKAKVPVRPA